MTICRRAPRGAPFAVLGLLLLAGCGDAPPADEGPEAGAPSRPFAVGWVPPGFEPLAAGTGRGVQDWGEDSTGTDEPFTLLRRGDDLVAVSVTGFEGYQGGLDQAVAGYEEAERIEVDGHQARLFLAGPTTRHRFPWNDLVVVRGDDLAVRVRGALGRDELVDLAGRTEPDGRERPPTVDPPDGFEVVGRATADLAVALEAGVHDRDHPPGPPTAHGAGWMSANRTLAVMALPSGAGDPEALQGSNHRFTWWGESEVEATEVDGRPAYVARSRDPECTSSCFETATLATTAPNGDLLVVRTDGAPLLPTDDLLHVAASVTEAEAATWEAFTVAVQGGPGLHPDPGFDEVARGEQDGVTWLLQARPALPEHFDNLVVYDGAEGGYWAEECLKLSTLRRACADHGSAGSADGTHYVSGATPGVHAGAADLSPFLVVVTEREAASVRIGGVEAPLHRLPGTTPRWAAVVFVEGPPFPLCHGEPRLELLDAAGAVVGCVG